MAVLGADVLVYTVEGAQSILLGGQKGASLEISKDTIEITAKSETAEKLREYTSGYGSWKVSCDGLVWDSQETYDMFVDKVLNGDAKFTLKLKIGSVTLTGEAICTGASIEGKFDAEATYSVSFQGTGPLTKVL